MKVGVPGEFHEDRWPRTAEDSERLVDPAHTGSGRDPSDTSYRVPKRSSGRSLARHPRLQTVLRQGRVAKGTSIGPSPRRPRPQVPQGHPRVARRSSTGPLPRPSCPQAFQPHPGLAPLPTGTSVTSPRGKGGFWPVFGTATLPTGTSETSPRGEEGFWTVFGTVTLPAGASVTYRRGEEGLLADLRHGHTAHRCSRGILAEPLGVGVSDSSPLGLREIHLARAVIDYQVVSN